MDLTDPTLAKIKQEFENITEDVPGFVKIESEEVKVLPANEFEFVTTEGVSFSNTHVKQEWDTDIDIEVNDLKTEDFVEEKVIKREEENGDTNSMDSNEAAVNKPAKKSVKCEVCGVMSRNNDSYLLHMMDHTGERPFKCDKCDKGFKREEQLACHRKTHAIIDNFPVAIRRTTFGRRGQYLFPQARKVIANVIEFMRSEAEFYQLKRLPRIPLGNHVQRIVAATGTWEGNPVPAAEHSLLEQEVHRRQAREIISNVSTFMKSESELYRKTKEPRIPLASYRQRVVAATGISSSMYYEVLRDSTNARKQLRHIFLDQGRGKKMRVGWSWMNIRSVPSEFMTI